ncbi:ribonuclease III domain-containing protein [Mycena sp. CBHHK59/15]|nr:ribonuclease III domain-containing protein [Mycena sp. CBHHK59/15]
MPRLRRPVAIARHRKLQVFARLPRLPIGPNGPDGRRPAPRSGALDRLARRLNIQSQFDSAVQLPGSPPVPIAMSFLQPDFGPDAHLFPPLPHIERADVRLQVFTHRSYFARPTHIFEDRPDDPSPDNEKFEHLGDAVLGLVVTKLMLDMYPGLRVGPSTKVRAMIVGNATLAEISVRYKLPEKLRLHPAQAVTLCASTNVQADVFESFIGGLYTDQGLHAVQPWLRALFVPYAAAAYAVVRAEHGLPPASLNTDTGNGDRDTGLATPAPSPTPTAGHLALFNQRLQQGARRVEWVYADQDPFGAGGTCDDAAAHARTSPHPRAGSKTTPVWCAEVLVDGEPLGRGCGNTKKAARNEAAKEGLVRLGVVVWCVTVSSSFSSPHPAFDADTHPLLHRLSTLGRDGQRYASRAGVQRPCGAARGRFKLDLCVSEDLFQWCWIWMCIGFMYGDLCGVDGLYFSAM